jgi:orotidine-5'-phosphate decarboxylase
VTAPAMLPFGQRLAAARTDRGPLCVGIDPSAALLLAWGLTDDPAGLASFCDTVTGALAGEIAVLKPQSAFFERHGSAGIAELEQLTVAARAAGALVLLDVKRGDIGSTVQAYADAYLRAGAPLACDAITVSPYLGVEALRPVFDAATAGGGGVFVVALSSNPEGASVQQARAADGTTVGAGVLAAVAAENTGAVPLGSVGAVVGATLGGLDVDLAVNGPLLAPGLGAQGAAAGDLRRVFGDAAGLVVASVSRSVLSAGPDPAALRTAALTVRDEVAAALG